MITRGLALALTAIGLVLWFAHEPYGPMFIAWANAALWASIGIEAGGRRVT